MRGPGRQASPCPQISVTSALLLFGFRMKVITVDKGRVVKVEKNVVFGSSERIEKRIEELPSNTINTSYVERSNLNWRMWDAHLTRKSLMFARSFRWLKAKFAICIGFYNLIRPHETLSRGEDRVFRPKTPAMAAGITDHPWTIKELFAHRI